MAQHTVSLEVQVVITTTDEGEAGLDRYVDLPVGNEFQVTPGLTKDQVLVWFATSCVYGRTDANQDGWADLDQDSIQGHIDDVREY